MERWIETPIASLNPPPSGASGAAATGKPNFLNRVLPFALQERRNSHD
jgi:hypothetical protein